MAQIRSHFEHETSDNPWVRAESDPMRQNRRARVCFGGLAGEATSVRMVLESWWNPLRVEEDSLMAAMFQAHAKKFRRTVDDRR